MRRWPISLILCLSITGPAFADGGSDGSGGNVLLSSEAEVSAAVAEAEQELRSAVKRIGMSLATRSPEEFDKQYGNGNFQLLMDGLLPTHDYQTVENIRNGQIRIVPQDGLCPSKSGHGDAAATGIGGKGTICVSLESLRKYPPASLRRELTALLLHEVGHLHGFDEEKAEALQTFALKNANLVVPERENLKSLERTTDELLASLPRLRAHLIAGSSDRKVCMESARANQLIEDTIRANFSVKAGQQSTQLPQTVLANMTFADYLGLDELRKDCDSDSPLNREKLVAKMETYETSLGQAVAELGTFVADGKRIGRLNVYVARDMLSFENSELYRRAKGLPAASPAKGAPTLACGRAWYRRHPDGKIRPEGELEVRKFETLYAADLGTIFRESNRAADGTDVSVIRLKDQSSLSLMIMAKDNGEMSHIDANEEEVAPGKVLTAGGIISVDSDKTTYIPQAHLAEGIRTNVNFFIPKPNGRYLGIRCDLEGKRNLVPFVPEKLREGANFEEDDLLAAKLALHVALALGDQDYIDRELKRCK